LLLAGLATFGELRLFLGATLALAVRFRYAPDIGVLLLSHYPLAFARTTTISQSTRRSLGKRGDFLNC
jgi:hypothetical protein